jgi:hypothetical protein
MLALFNLGELITIFHTKLVQEGVIEP